MGPDLARVTFPGERPPPRPSGRGPGSRLPRRGDARGVSGGHFPRRKASASSKRAGAWFASPSAGESQGRLRRSLSPEESLCLVQAGGGLVCVALSGGKPGASPAVTFLEGRPPPRPSGPGFGPRHPQRGEARGVSGGHFPRRKASASSRRARAWSRPCCHKARIFSTSRSVRWKPAVLSGAKSSTFPSRSSWNSRSRDWL